MYGVFRAQVIKDTSRSIPPYDFWKNCYEFEATRVDHMYE